MWPSMAITELYSGTEAVGATEWSLVNDSSTIATETSDGIVQSFLDISDMVAGDILQIRFYEKARSGDAQQLAREWVLVGAEAEGLWVSESFIVMHGWDFTVKALAGTITVNWSIRRVT